jgi:hypothetical protein
VELIRLDRTPPDGIIWQESMFRKKTPDWEKIAEFCKRYTLKSILKELPIDLPAENPQAESPDAFDLFSIPAPTPVPEEKPQKTEQKNDYEQLSLF